MSEKEIVLTQTQRHAVETARGKTVFLGGPGSGKTTVVAERAAALIAGNIARSEEVLVLAPTPRAALALAKQIRERLGSTPAPIATSFGGLAITILRRHYREMGYSQYPLVLNSARQIHDLREFLRKEKPGHWPTYGNSLEKRPLLMQVHDLTMRAAENGWSLEELPSRMKQWGRPDLVEVAEFCRRYRQHLRNTGATDFGELFTDVAELLSANPGIAAVYRDAYRHILVDQYEDANFVQAEILRHLVAEDTDLLVVGDPEQAINGYLSGSASHLLASSEKFDANVLVSPDDFRTSGALATLGNTVRPEAPRSALPCPAGHNQEGYTVLRPFTYPADEARWVAVEIDSLLKAGVPTKQISILLRNLSSPITRLINAELARRGIPVNFQSSHGVFKDPQVRAAVQLLRYLVQREDSDTALLRFLETPLAGLPPFGLKDLRRLAAVKNCDVVELVTADLEMESLQTSEELRTALAELRERLTSLKAHTAWSADGLLWEIWRLFPTFHQEALNGGKGSATYAVFLNEVSALQESRWLGLPDLVDLIDQGYFDRVIGLAKSQSGVTITTIHQAKGKQWDTVFLPGLIEGVFPHRPSSQDIIGTILARDLLPPANGDGLQAALTDRHLAEEARVFYVGVTRASRNLFLSYSGRSTDGGSAELPTRFLDVVAGCPTVEVVQGDESKQVPLDLEGAIAWYRQRLASADPLHQTQAMYALDQIRRRWPEAVRAEVWWDNIEETDGAASPFKGKGLYLSASRLGNYRNCPLAYQFGYHWRLGETESPALTMGSLLHAILEEYHRPGSKSPRSRAALEKLLEDNFDEEAFGYRPVAQQVRRKLSEMLDKYYERYGLDESVVDVEKRIEFMVGPHTITGFVDRIDRKASGELELIDYKTGSAMSKEDAQRDLQLALYDLAFYRDWELAELGRPTKVSYLYLKNIGPRADGKRSHSPTDETRVRLQSLVEYYAGAIRKERFPSRFDLATAFPYLDPEELIYALGKGSCMFCSYMWLCPANDRGEGEN